MLKVQGILVRTGDGIDLLIYPNPYGFSVLNKNGIAVTHPDIDIIESAQFNNRVTEAIENVQSWLDKRYTKGA